jgi:4,5-DOPA dioxygenase extradiol
MNRKQFLFSLASFPFVAHTANNILEMNLPNQHYHMDEKMPALFIGHGSPMNAIEVNDFTLALKALGTILPIPKAIVVVSAHWLTRGTFVHTAAQPRMIYDMGGFPDELYRVHYPAPGAPTEAEKIISRVQSASVLADASWGFDHGMWSIMLHLFPKANIPVFQLSIDYGKHPAQHLQLAKELDYLRSNGVMLIGSGNITHNLRDFDLANINANPADWALEFDDKIRTWIDAGNHDAIADYQKLGKLSAQAHPEPSHFLPLFYTLGLRDEKDTVTYPYDKFQYGTFSMRCVKIG